MSERWTRARKEWHLYRASIHLDRFYESINKAERAGFQIPDSVLIALLSINRALLNEVAKEATKDG